MSKSFYNEQSDITAAKIKIYKEYIEGYLPKILLTFGCCLIADLFCGAGKNGDKDGSPLVLINRAEHILTNEVIRGKNPKPEINVLFADTDRAHIANLNLHLNQFLHPSIKIRPPKKINFKDVLPEILAEFKTDTMPKFFFLDPFSYSNITMDSLNSLMDMPHTEIFLFTPIFHSYRFSNEEYAPKHKTRIFIESFTEKGISDYDGVNDFIQSIKQKLKQQLNLNYVRPVLLDDGRLKNAIFLLTKHREGMLLMNKVVFRQSNDGRTVSIKEQQSGQFTLPGIQEEPIPRFAKNLKQELKNKGEMTNKEIVEFSIREEFLPKHAKEILNALCDKGKINVADGANDITRQKTKWNIAEKPTKNIIFNYVH